MNIVLDVKSPKPLYEQIYEQLSAQILNGELAPDLCLPSIRAVARDLSISIITVKKAWELLEQHDFIYTRAGLGCFVSSHQQSNLDEKKFDLARAKLKENLAFYKGLNLSKDELQKLIDELY